jgi:hypothetical protein
VLKEGIEVVIGRGSHTDLLLLEGMVSRRHATLTLTDGVAVLVDLGSMNGTFVNGERIRGKRNLEEGDRVLIGDSILKLVQSDAKRHTLPPRPDDPQLLEDITRDRAQMEGDLEDTSISDILELLAGTRQNVVVRFKLPGGTGSLVVRDARVVDARLQGLDAEAPPEKCLERLLAQAKGRFTVKSLRDGMRPPERMREDIPSLLVDGRHKLDELHVLQQRLPTPDVDLVVARPLRPALSALDEAELDLLQLVHNIGRVGKVLDSSPETDLDTTRRLLALLDGGYLHRA